MRRLRCSIGLMLGTIVILATNLAVIRSQTGPPAAPGAGRFLYAVRIDAKTDFPLLGFVLGFLPMASVLGVATVGQVLQIRRSGSVSASAVGFVTFGWLSILFLLVLVGLAPPLYQRYIFWVLAQAVDLLGPVILAALGSNATALVETAFELAFIVAATGLPQLLVAMLGRFLAGRRGGCLRWEPQATKADSQRSRTLLESPSG